MFWVLVFLVGGGCFTWNMEASVAGKYDSASQDIDACDHFLEVWKSKLSGIFFRFVPHWRGWSYQQLNKLPYSDVYGSWIASSSQLTKRYWFHDGLDVSRETQGGVVVSFLLAVWDWVGLLMACFT